MPRINDFIATAGAENLSVGEADWLHQLLADWSVLSDLAAADLVLWIPTQSGRFLAAAHCRPTTAPTIHVDDVLNLYMPQLRAQILRQALEEKRIVASDQPRWAGAYSVNEVAVPIVFQGRAIAVMTREATTVASFARGASAQWYSEVADTLCQMMTRGDFPYPATPAGGSHGTPRLSDGAVRLDSDGTVIEVTPNAVSCFRRLGVKVPLLGLVLAEVVTELMESQGLVEETLAVVVMGRASWRCELDSHGATVTLRALPLTEAEVKLGGLLLCRDVTEMRRHERELMTKDATIREIHHRVKNNLQTVSALLRMQARRCDSVLVKDALAQAERRVSTIASVHEALSHNVDETVDFDPVARQVLRLAAAVATSEGEATATVEGEFGQVNADAASALSVVLAELVTNAVEHGYQGQGGDVKVVAKRNDNELRVEVLDRGVGIELGQELSGLGTQIVKTFVQSELGGTIEWRQRSGGGTKVLIHTVLN